MREKPPRFAGGFTPQGVTLNDSFDGYAKDGRMLRVILFLSRGKVRFKTAYEIFEI